MGTKELSNEELLDLPTLTDQEKLAFRELQLQEVNLQNEKMQRQSEFYQIELAILKVKQAQLEKLQSVSTQYNVKGVDFDHQTLEFKHKT